MIVKNFKFKGDKCFKSEYSGLDEFKPITIIIGRNNSGKSQLIDVLSLLTEQKPRVNHLDYQVSGFLDEKSLRSVFRSDITGGKLPGFSSHWDDHGKWYLDQPIEWEFISKKRTFVINKLDSLQSTSRKVEDLRRHLILGLLGDVTTPLRGKVFSRLAADRDIRPEKFNIQLDLDPNGVGATNVIRRLVLAYGPGMREDLIQKDLLEALSRIFGGDGDFTRIELRHHEEQDLWEIFLGEPKKSLVPLSRSGSGLKTVILVLLHLLVLPYLESKEKNQFVFAFEELENNLHPALLRRLFQFITNYVERESCTLFLTTHSSVALDFFGYRKDTQIIRVDHDGETASTKTISAHFDQVELLTELGSRPSDLLQANGVLWLEGPSDRIYINHFINLYSNGSLREGRDYQCAFYGGSILAKTTFVSPDVADPTFTNLLRLNHNVAIICDGDRTAKSGKGSRIKERVRRIKEEVEQLKSAFLWITETKEIENYIPGSVWSLVYGVKNIPDPGQFDTFPCISSDDSGFVQRHLNRRTFDKCDFATQAINHLNRENLSNRFDFDTKMSELVERIKQWNE